MSLSTCQSTGLVAASAVVFAAPVKIHSITLLQAAAACTAIIYDNATAASGTEIEQVNNNTNTSTVVSSFNVPIECSKGAYVAITGAGAKVIVRYSAMG
jgi:hypothetical protein